MNVKEKQNFKLRKVKYSANKEKHEQINTQFVNSTITGCDAQNPKSVGLILPRFCMIKTQMIFGLINQVGSIVASKLLGGWANMDKSVLWGRGCLICFCFDFERKHVRVTADREVGYRAIMDWTTGG